jgi:6-phosphogluconolactonase
MKYFISLILFFCAKNIMAQKHIMLIGTYDSPKSEGIYVYEFDSNNGTAKALSHIKTPNPSFIEISKNNKFVYAVNETASNDNTGGGISSFYFNKDSNKLVFINQQASKGNHPCHLSLDKANKNIAVANYTGGNFSIFNINKDGSLDTAKQVIQHYGNSADTARQKSPHVHSVYYGNENKKLFVADLGTDKVSIYDIIKKTNYIEPKGVVILESKKGAGPRHIAFNKNETTIYVLEELKGNIIVYNKDLKKGFEKVQSISNVPDTFKGFAGSADIHLSGDGNFLYASNRGASNTIAIYKINKNDGTLNLITHQSTLGIAPRNFNFDPSEKYLLVANQNSNEIVIFERDAKTGLLKDTENRINVGKPVCIKWIKK